MNYPSIPGEVLQLDKYRVANALTAATLATDMSTFGWTWTTAHVADLIAGRRKSTGDERVFIRKFLLQRFYDYNLSV